jgi:predicted ATP-grasp superfamily ATP-dependent carboligase
MLLIAGASARAAAESAARAGFAVTALDGYADIDQHPSVRALAAGSGDGATADALARAAAAIDADEVVYLSPFENHPTALDALAHGRRLLGNSLDVVERVRDPLVVARTFTGLGFTVPRVIPGGHAVDGGTAGHSRWLLKPVRSGGGHGVVPYAGAGAVPAGWYLQEFVDGWVGSVTFVATRGECRVLAVSRQLVGEAAFGASGYRYCGSLVAIADDPRTAAIWKRAQALAQAAARAFALVGVNGIDFVARDDGPLPIEINPRWSSSMELVDRATTTPVMGAHIEACHGSLIDVTPAAGRPPVAGKAIVFARRDVVMPDTSAWLGDHDLRDVPPSHQRIGRGQPICTVFAEATSEDACCAALAARAARLYARLEIESV